jgi:hypothetical protein
MPIDRKALLDVMKAAVAENAQSAQPAPAGASLAAGLAFIADAFDRLEARLMAAETSPFKYLGPHEQGRAYNKNEFVSFGGSMWHAQRDNAQRPGDGDAWVLAVKHGRDSR